MNKIKCIECRKRYVDKDSVCINVCSKCLYGDEDDAICEVKKDVHQTLLKLNSHQ